MWFVLSLACSGHDSNEPFPTHLAPLEDNRAKLPAPLDGDPYPERLSVVSGGNSDLWWAHGRGYLKAEASVCWQALLDPEVGVDRREVDEWSITYDVAPQFDASYVVHNVAQDVLTVAYDLTWLHELQLGSASEPEEVVGVWDKTDGTTFIDILEGSFVLRAVEPEVTEIEIIEHLKAPLRDDATLVSYLQDLHASITARIHEQPLPVY